MSDRVVSYEFGPREKRGRFLGLRDGQLGVVAVGMVSTLVVLQVTGSVFVASLLLLGGAGLALARLHGRGLDEWAPVTRRFVLQWLRRERREHGADPERGRRTGQHRQPPKPPQTLRGIEVLEGPGGVGVVKDGPRGTWTGAIAIRGAAFPLASLEEKSQRLAGWGAVLDSLAHDSSFVHRIQTIERTAPADADELHDYLRERATLPADSQAVRSYLDLIGDAQPATQRHETLVVLTVGGRAARRAIKKAGRGDADACQVLVDELRSLASLLAQAGLELEGALPPRLYAATIRTAFDPDARHQIVRGAAATVHDEGLGSADLWPTATDVDWGAYRTDGVWHATYWIAEWPRMEVGADFLAPLLLHTRAARTVSLVFEPIEDERATREVNRAIVADVTDEHERTKRGFVTTPERDAQHRTTLRRARELADGHGDYRYSAYVTVTAHDLDALRSACAEVERKARQAKLRLRRMYGQQDLAFTYTLPLGRGLRGGLGTRKGTA